jgi:hypothetical protein
MQVSKAPPVDVPTARAGTATTAEQRSPSAATVAPTAIQADIRPLDISSALQILLAEVRAGLDLALAAAVARDPAMAHNPAIALNLAIAQDPTSALNPAIAQNPAITQNPTQTARALVETFLQILPQEEASNAPQWIAAMVHLEAAIQSSMERAIGVVTQWRDVPAVVVDAAKEARALFSSALGEGLQNPLWLRPEWMSLAPLFYRFRRRRRIARRRLTDPDYSPGSLDESEELRE